MQLSSATRFSFTPYNKHHFASGAMKFEININVYIDLKKTMKKCVRLFYFLDPCIVAEGVPVRREDEEIETRRCSWSRS